MFDRRDIHASPVDCQGVELKTDMAIQPNLAPCPRLWRPAAIRAVFTCEILALGEVQNACGGGAQDRRSMSIAYCRVTPLRRSIRTAIGLVLVWGTPQSVWCAEDHPVLIRGPYLQVGSPT